LTARISQRRIRRTRDHESNRGAARYSLSD
jgi:hypothetical protein